MRIQALGSLGGGSMCRARYRDARSPASCRERGRSAFWSEFALYLSLGSDLDETSCFRLSKFGAEGDECGIPSRIGQARSIRLGTPHESAGAPEGESAKSEENRSRPLRGTQARTRSSTCLRARARMSACIARGSHMAKGWERFGAGHNSVGRVPKSGARVALGKVLQHQRSALCFCGRQWPPPAPIFARQPISRVPSGSTAPSVRI